MSVQKSDRSSGVHLSLNNFLALLSLITSFIASNLPFPFFPLTLTPRTLGRFHHVVGICASQNPKLRQQRSQARARATLDSGVSASPAIVGSFSSLAVSSLRSQREASASASNPRNRS